MSTSRRTPGVFASPPPKDANGKKVCRNCLGPLKSQRQHNCSAKCTEEWIMKTSPSVMRWHMFQRDKGICAICRADTVAQQKEYIAAVKKHGTAFCSPVQEIRERFGVTAGRAASGDWWDADHINPVIEGGGECGLENMRTLCIPCHKQETAKLRRRIADHSKALKAIENDKGGLFADQLEGM